MLPAIDPPVVNNIEYAVYNGDIADADASQRVPNIADQTLVDLVVSEHQVFSMLNSLRETLPQCIKIFSFNKNS